jgi:uncharacterized protein (TIGR00255 family)
MIKSMTGFGKSVTRSAFGVFIVEIRTVNHRFFDLSSKVPNGLSVLEDRIKEFLQKNIKRGKVNFFLTHRSCQNNYEALTFDEKAVSKYYKVLQHIRKKFHIKEDIEISDLLSFPDVIVHEQEELDVEAMWGYVEKSMKNAVKDCNTMRDREGKALYKDIAGRIKNVSGIVQNIEELAPGIVVEYKHRLDAKIKELLDNKNVDKERLELEVALFAKQCDISEELTRAKSHLDGFHKALQSDDESGRRLDFILQELNREINTMGQKANSVKIAGFVIDIKSELEKIREQVQNIE